jgi:RNA polymerase sigma factor (sigma-70 family)
MKPEDDKNNDKPTDPAGDDNQSGANEPSGTPDAENLDEVLDEIEEERDRIRSRWLDVGFTLKQLQAKDSDAWNALIRILLKTAERYITASFRNPGDLQPLTFSDAEDLTLEIVARIYEKIGTFKSLDHLEASFRKQLKHGSVSLKRKAQAGRHGGGKVYSFGDPELASKQPKDQADKKYDEKVKPFTTASIENDDDSCVPGRQEEGSETDSIEQMELRKIIFDCATKLDATERDLLSQVYQNQQHHEIAQALNIGTSSVGVRLQRVYEKLAPMIQSCLGNQELKDYGINPH